MPSNRKIDTVPVGVNRIVTAVIGAKEDWTGANNYFETDQAIGSTPSLYMNLTIPGLYGGTGPPFPQIERFLLTDVFAVLSCATVNTTYTLRLLEGTTSNQIQKRAFVAWESPSGLAAVSTGPAYLRFSANGRQVPGGTTKTDSVLPCIVNLQKPPRLYYMLDWAAAPHNVRGGIFARGTLLK